MKHDFLDLTIDLFQSNKTTPSRRENSLLNKKWMNQAYDFLDYTLSNFVNYCKQIVYLTQM